MPKPSAMRVPDSAPELLEEADSLASAGDDDDGDKTLGEGQGEGDEEEEEEVEEEEEEMEGVEVEEEEEAQADGNGEGNEEEEEGADLSDEGARDRSKKHEGHCKEPKSVPSNPEESYINSANSHVKDVRGGNLDKNPPSKLHNRKTSEMNDGNASQHTPQRKPGSSSPSTEHESVNKKPAIICNFFARGWCIKGSSCRFLHKKERVGCTSQVAKEDRTTEEDSIDCKGSEKDEKSSVSASIDLIGLPNVEISRTSGFLLQRALVQRYGGEIHGFSQIKGDDNLHASKNFSNEHFPADVSYSGRASYLAVDKLRQKSMFQENQRTDGVIHNFDFIDDRHSASGELLSRQYPNERRMYKEMPRRESLNNASFSRASSFTKDPLTSEYNYLFGGSSTSTNVYKDISNIYSHGIRPDNTDMQCQQRHFPLHDSYNSCLTSSVNSSFDNSLHLLQGSPLIESLNSFAQAGTRLTCGSPLLSAEHEDIHRTFNYSRRFSVTASGQRNIAGGALASSGQKQKLQESTWEPSIPFRPSFFYAPTIISSESQYDPLVDSIDHSKVGIITSASPRGIAGSVSSQHIIGDPILGGDLTPGYNSNKSVNPSTPTYESILGIKNSLPEHCGYTTAVAPGPTTFDGGINFAAKEEKNQVSHLSDAAHVNEADPGSNMRNVEKGDDAKELKAVKIFRAALVEFVKELLKPSWKEGRLSRDAHKMIVKKAVEKILSALQPHQVPSDTESIDQYLSGSRPKLWKLVKGYVAKYNKS